MTYVRLSLEIFRDLLVDGLHPFAVTTPGCRECHDNVLVLVLYPTSHKYTNALDNENGMTHQSDVVKCVSVQNLERGRRGRLDLGLDSRLLRDAVR